MSVHKGTNQLARPLAVEWKQVKGSNSPYMNLKKREIEF